LSTVWVVDLGSEWSSTYVQGKSASQSCKDQKAVSPRCAAKGILLVCGGGLYMLWKLPEPMLSCGALPPPSVLQEVARAA